MLVNATVFNTAVGKHTQQRDVLGFEERQDAIVEHVGGNQRILAIIELGRSGFGVRVDKRLLVDASHTLELTDIERILSPQITGMLGFDLPISLFLILGLLQGNDLAFGEDQSVLSDFGFQGLETELERLEVVTKPNTANVSKPGSAATHEIAFPAEHPDPTQRCW